MPPGLKRGANARPAGEDVARAVALPAGRRLRPPEIGLAAALGCASLAVAPRVRVGVFSTGDELAAPGAPLGPAQTYDSNRFTLLALLARLPVLATRSRHPAGPGGGDRRGAGRRRLARMTCC